MKEQNSDSVKYSFYSTVRVPQCPGCPDYETEREDAEREDAEREDAEREDAEREDAEREDAEREDGED